MWTDIEGRKDEVSVYVTDENFDVKASKYIKISCIIGEPFDGITLSGSKAAIPTITAKKQTSLSYIEAVSQTIKEIETDSTLS